LEQRRSAVEEMGVNREFGWVDRPVLVTGASGLLGGWLTRRLMEAGADVVCLLRDWIPQCELAAATMLERVKVVRGNICHQALLERVLGEYEINTVFHLAAQTQVGVANRNPVSTFESNISGTWKMLEACRRSPLVKSVVLASSDKAYGQQTQLPYTEQSALAGIHPYDVSKACADMLGQSYAASYGLPVAITRCGNFFGGGDLNWNRLVPGTIRSVLRGERPVIRSDGRYQRDYLYVEDGVSSYLLLAARLWSDETLRGRAFNFSNESRVSVLEMVGTILRLMHSPLEPDVRNEARHEILDQFLSTERARTELGWRPEWTLEEGLHRTIDWYRKHLNGATDDFRSRELTFARPCAG
jgi:CDP-glucose 4,6-dehydratase